MTTKLTLTLDQSVIEKAKQYAKGQGRSLSKIIENYLKAITSGEKKQSIKASPIIDSLRGSFKAPKNFDYKEELAKRLESKYVK